MFIVPLSSLSPDFSLGQTQDLVEVSRPSVPFSDIFASALENVQKTQTQSDKDAYDLAMGNIDNIPAIMINSEKAAAAMELTVQLTTRAVNAYKEISQMQV